jgi:hypothetical protein
VPILGLRVRATGTANFFPDQSTTLNPGGNVVLEGFDLVTGNTKWAFDTGADAALLDGNAAAQMKDYTVVLPNHEGILTEVDLLTGAQRPLPAGTLGWCSAATTYEGPGYKADNGLTLTTYYGDSATFPCDAGTGQPQPAPSIVPSFVGPSIGGVTAWSQGDRVVAAPSGVEASS